MRTIRLFILFLFTSFHSFTQERKVLDYSIRLEAHLFEADFTRYIHATYAGQTATSRLSYPMGKQLDLGVNVGVYLHYRESRYAPNVYLYCPVQAALNFHTLNNRFAIEIATGYPIKVKEYKPYLFQNGFWFKDVFSEKDPDMVFSQNEVYKRHTIFLVSTINFKFRLGHTEHLFLTAGARVMNFQRAFKEIGINGKDYVLEGVETYNNLSLGLEYQFR